MGTDPYQHKMPNRNLGREMGKEDDEKSTDVNVQDIASDPHAGDKSLETNFSHVKKERKY